MNSQTLNKDFINELYEASNLTWLQTIYWISQSLRKDSQIFNTIYTYTIMGRVDINHYKRAFQSLVMQSDAFRVVIEEDEGLPNQRILSYVPQELTFLDFSRAVSPENEYQAWLGERISRILDLAKCSYDSVLVKMSEDQYVWYLNQHHMFVDANSFTIIFNRMAMLYERSLRGDELTLDGIPSFMEYVEYEKEFKRSKQYKKGVIYWKDKLQNKPNVIGFFGEVPRKRTTKVERRSVDIGAGRSIKIRKIARQKEFFTVSEEFSQFNLFAGLFFTLLYQLSGNNRLGLVTPVHNRFTRKFRETVGLLLEFSPLIVEISQGDTLESVIQKTKHESRENIGHYQSASAVVANYKIIEIMFNTYVVREMFLDGSYVHAKRIHPGYGTESLSLHITDVEITKSFELHFDFHEDIFNSDQIEQIILGYLDLLDLLILNPKKQINKLKMFLPQCDQSFTETMSDQNTHMKIGKSGGVPINGLRVKLGEIESRIMKHPQIQEAVVLADEHPTSGKRLVAYIVPLEGEPSPTSEELRLYLKEDLPDSMIPGAFVILESMPLTPTGKINQLALPSLEEVYDLAQDHVPPHTEVEKKLVAIWEKELGVSPIGIRHDFFDLGGYSLLAANVVVEIERTFNKQIDISLLSERPTVQQLAQVLALPGSDKKISSIVPIQNSGSRPPLFCVHGVGGHVLPFTLLAKHLGPDQPVIGLQIDRILEEFGDSYTIETIASEYNDEIQSYFPKGPYYLSGFSFGGFVAFEMARQLVAKGVEVRFLGLFDTQAAAAPGYRRSLSKRKLLQYRVKSYLTKTKYHGNNLIRLSPGQMRSYWTTRNAVPDPEQAIMGDVNPDQVPGPMQKIISSNLQALKNYVPEDYAGRVVLFRSRDHGLGVYYGWDELAHGGVDVCTVPGTHRGILQEPNVAALAEQMRAYLDKTITH